MISAGSEELLEDAEQAERRHVLTGAVENMRLDSETRIEERC